MKKTLFLFLFSALTNYSFGQVFGKTAPATTLNRREVTTSLTDTGSVNVIMNAKATTQAIYDITTKLVGPANFVDSVQLTGVTTYTYTIDAARKLKLGSDNTRLISTAVWQGNVDISKGVYTEARSGAFYFEFGKTPVNVTIYFTPGVKGANASQTADLTAYSTKAVADQLYQPKGNYLTSLPDLTPYLKSADAQSAYISKAVSLLGAFTTAVALESGIYRNENGKGGNIPYAPVLSLKSGDGGLLLNGGFNTDSLKFRGWDQNGARWTPWRSVWHSGNFDPALKANAGDVYTKIQSGLLFQPLNSFLTDANQHLSNISSPSFSEIVTKEAGLNKPIQDTLTGINKFMVSNVAGGLGSGREYWISIAKTLQVLGLDKVDNVSDLNKPVSFAQKAALDGKLNTTDVGTSAKHAETDYVLVTNTSAIPVPGKIIAYGQDSIIRGNIYGNANTSNTAKRAVVAGSIDNQSPAATTPQDVNAISNTLALRTPEGWLRGSVLFSTNTVDDGTPLTDILGTGNDGFHRRYSFGAVKTALQLNNVNNTSDAAKPVSTAQQAALDAKANKTDLGTLAGKNRIAYAADIDGVPVIPAAQVQADVNQTDPTKLDYIKNQKTSLSQFVNDLQQVIFLGNSVTAYTQAPADRFLIVSKAGMTVTLNSSVMVGKQLTIKNVSSGAITVSGSINSQIDLPNNSLTGSTAQGSSSTSVSAGASLNLIYLGQGLFITN